MYFERLLQYAFKACCPKKPTAQHCFHITSPSPSTCKVSRSVIQSLNHLSIVMSLSRSIPGLLVFISAATANIAWSSCGTGLECGNLEVPLEYGDSASTAKASIALIRYNSTVSSSNRLGSLFVNPGGPGASGVNFVAAGAGSAISQLTSGLYDIIGWDPRGVGASTPLLQCFADAGSEYDFASALPAAPDLWLESFSNSSADTQVESAITDFDTSIAALAEACVNQNSEALYTSSAAYVARDMRALLDTLEGSTGLFNYWGFSYGTIFLTEFIQAFPTRVGRIVADGVFDAEANAKTYLSQLPNDQLSVRDSLNDFASLCSDAGVEGCSFAGTPSGSTSDIATRIDGIFEDLFTNPITISGLTISLDIFNVFMWSLLRVPTTWQMVSEVLSGLEDRNATAMLSVLIQTADAAPTERAAPGVGTLVTNPLQCVDNAASSSITLAEIISLVKTISINQDTPLLSADLTPISFCRNFPDTRPLLPNVGVSLLSETDSILAAASKKILIVSPLHDPVTPLASARRLRALLPDSSVLAIRGGSGHTTVSHASLGMAETIAAFFRSGVLPAEEAFFAVDQVIFPVDVEPSLVAPFTYNTTGLPAQQSAVLEAVYNIGLAFLAIG